MFAFHLTCSNIFSECSLITKFWHEFDVPCHCEISSHGRHLLFYRTKSSGVNKAMSDGWDHLPASVSGSLCFSCWLIVTLWWLPGTREENWVVVYVSCNAGVFPTKWLLWKRPMKSRAPQNLNKTWSLTWHHIIFNALLISFAIDFEIFPFTAVTWMDSKPFRTTYSL